MLRLPLSLILAASLMPLAAAAVELREGIELPVSYSNEVLGKVGGPGTHATIDEGLFQAGVQIDFDKLFHWHGLTLTANAYYAHGSSLTDRYVHDLNVLSNIDAYDTVRLSEAWLQQTFFEDRFSLKAGVLVVDTDFYAVESGTLFLNSAFGAESLLAINTSAPTFPLSAPGARVEWKPSDDLSFRVGAYSGDVGGQDVNNKHGTRFAFSSETGGLFFGEVEKHVSLGAGQLPGVIKLGGFYDSAVFDDLSGHGAPTRGLGTLYGIWDQAVYRPPAKADPKDAHPAKDANKEEDEDDRGVNVFFRGGWAFPEDHPVVDASFEVGLVQHGLLFGREKDSCGIALAYTHLSSEAHELDGTQVTDHHEAIIEGTYRCTLHEHLALQPDVQVIFNPGGSTRAATAVVVGLRAIVSF